MSVVANLTAPYAEETRACREAQRAWAHLPLRERLKPVARLRKLLVTDADLLCQSVERDVKRPASEVLLTDILPAADACRFVQRVARRTIKSRTVSLLQRPLWLFGQRDVVYRRPHGVIGIIGTWNYPILLNGVQIVQAVTAGNGVLWKPSELVPETSERFHGLLLRAGFPEGLIQRLSATREAGPLVAEANVDHVVFTGSANVGRKLAARLGERLISSTMELSGCDAFFVLADADLALAAKAAWFGVTLNKGQTCIAVRRIFVDQSVYQPFLDALKIESANSHSLSLALESQVDQAERLIQEGERQGAQRLYPNGIASGSQMSPVVLINATPEMAICREASFAPIAAVMPFRTVDEAIEMNAKCEYGLGASIFAGDIDRARQLAERLPVGMVTINDALAPTAHPATPFGGRMASGWGVTQGAEGLLAMTVPQVVSIRRDKWRPHYQPIGPSSPLVGLMRGMLEWSHGGGKACLRGVRRIVANARKVLR
jgi:acyl-CoA reductase-like NAD-dependent aldehyde dehydrogenase